MPAKQRTVFRTIGTVRPDQVPRKRLLELNGGVDSLPQVPRWNADRRARRSPAPQTQRQGDQARGRIRRCGRRDDASAGVPPS